MGGSILAYFFSTFFSARNLRKKIVSAFFIGLPSILSIIIINKTALIPLVLFSLSLIIFRFSISYSSNLIKTLQLKDIKAKKDRSCMLGYIKVTTSVGGALGPILGSFLFNQYNVIALLFFSAILFFLSALLILLLTSKTHGVEPARVKGESLFRMPRDVFFLCLIALIHFVFEAQIYAFMAISVEKNNHEAAFLPLMFSVNAILLITLTIPVLNVIRRWRVNSVTAILFGSFLSLISIITSPYCHSSISILVITLLFTLGEIITPQIILQKISQSDNHHEILKFLSTYNLMTFGVGLTFGYFLSSWAVSLQKPLYSSLAFICVYAFLFILLCIKRKTA
ncbi:major facilitator superfamily MFS_1 [Pantoea sp. At-9b]|nr:major facilitator superfamily MFS_1 [Pantoea sp. At-9b]